MLTDIDIAHQTAVCHDYMSSIHKQDPCAYHDAIIMAMIQAYSETISTSKSGCSNIKPVTGWNEYTEEYFRTSLLWHSLGVDNDKPRHGIVATLRCKTRAQYHRVCKMVFRKDAEIRCVKMAEAIISNPSSKSLYQQGYVIIKPPESGELCEEITEFVVVKESQSPQGEGNLPPPQTK